MFGSFIFYFIFFHLFFGMNGIFSIILTCFESNLFSIVALFLFLNLKTNLSVNGAEFRQIQVKFIFPPCKI